MKMYSKYNRDMIISAKQDNCRVVQVEKGSLTEDQIVGILYSKILKL